MFPPSSPGKSRPVTRVQERGEAAQWRYQKALAAFAQRQLDVSERMLAALVVDEQDWFEARRLLGVVLRTQRRHDEAVSHLDHACRLHPKDGLARMDLAIALYESGQIDAALSKAEQATELAPREAGLWFNHGRMLKLQGMMAEAERSLNGALHCDPAHLLARLLLAEIYAGRGDAETAAFHYRRILCQAPHDPQAWIGLSNLKVKPLTTGDASQLRDILRRSDLEESSRVALGFSMAAALEDQGDYSAAFDALQEANALNRRLLGWNAAQEHHRLKALVQVSGIPRPVPKRPDLGDNLIFVVSLPRSGSSLLEQMLASHSEVEGGGELLDLQQMLDTESTRRGRPLSEWIVDADAEDWDRLGTAYLRRTAKLRQSKPRSTDKNLANWKFVDIIMRMLPGAQVVHCTRDALETCLACYRQWFSRGNEFSYDLQDMAAYWGDHVEVCRIWKQRYPERFHELRHESLLADPRGELERLLNALGLPFDENCLRYHHNPRHVATASAVQVRQPLRPFTARAAHYSDQLKLLRELLARRSQANLISTA